MSLTAKKTCRMSELVVRLHSSGCPAHEADHVACLRFVAPCAGNTAKNNNQAPERRALVGCTIAQNALVISVGDRLLISLALVCLWTWQSMAVERFQSISAARRNWLGPNDNCQFRSSATFL